MIPCLPTSQLSHFLSYSKFMRRDTPISSLTSSSFVIGRNLVSLNADYKVYLVNYLSSGPEEKVPIQPRSSSLSIWNVINTGASKTGKCFGNSGRSFFRSAATSTEKQKTQ
jgi:hypothetical protein